MSEEKVDEALTADRGSSPRTKDGKKAITITVAIVAVIAVLGVGMFIWHGQPSFCGQVCHTPMQPYVDSYHNNDGATSLAYTHNLAGEKCLDCHPARIDEQVTEATHWVAGDYAFDQDSQRLISRSGEIATQDFCLSEDCHNLDLDQLREATSSMAWNPHDFTEHGMTNCGDCHKMHGQSVLVCSECHYQAAENVPEGWDSIPYREQR